MHTAFEEHYTVTVIYWSIVVLNLGGGSAELNTPLFLVFISPPITTLLCVFFEVTNNVIK